MNKVMDKIYNWCEGKQKFNLLELILFILITVGLTLSIGDLIR